MHVAMYGRSLIACVTLGTAAALLVAYGGARKYSADSIDFAIGNDFALRRAFRITVRISRVDS